MGSDEPTLSHAATHCELESELHVLQTGQVYIARNLSARKLCSKDEYINNYNLCAGVNIIGPISDVRQTSKDAKDAADEDSDLTEDTDQTIFNKDDDLRKDDKLAEDGGGHRNRLLQSGGS